MAGRNLIPVGLAVVCGVATGLAVWQPEFKKIREERQGTFQTLHTTAASEGAAVKEPAKVDTVISDAIISDIKEVAKSLDQPKGFGWALREALFFKPKQNGTEVEKKSVDDR